MRAGRHSHPPAGRGFSAAAKLPRTALSQCQGVRFTLPQGGFHLTLKVGGAEVDEEALCIDLLRGSGVLVHPGYFYDMPPAHLVLTFALRHELLRPVA